jgi:hypothetical protein
VRSALQKIEGVSDIETNVAARSCKFKLSNPELDLVAKLNEFAKTNSHIAGYTIVAGAK